MVEACGGDSTAAIVLGHMVFRTFNGERWHTATIEDVTAMTGLSYKQVRRSLDMLRDEGHIQSRRADRWNPTLEWNLVMAPEEQQVMPPQGHHEEPTGGITLRKEEEVQEEDQPPAGGGVIHQFSLAAPPVPSHRETADVLFDRFWEAYPKKVDKGHARKMFLAALKKADIDILIAAVEKQKRTTWLNKERQYIPNPGTWLNGERWLDEPDQPRTASTTYTRTESINYDGPSTYKAPKNRWA